MGGALLSPAAAPQDASAGSRSLHRRCVPCVRRTAADLGPTTDECQGSSFSLGVPKMDHFEIDGFFRTRLRKMMFYRGPRGGGSANPRLVEK